jgi:microcystin-dependent protein
MAEPFVAQISVFGFNFAPRGWALCQGQLLPISQNTALFSLLGTNFGGDGKSTFGLPNFEDQAGVSAGQGPGLSQYVVGEAVGTPTVTLLQTELPGHNHSFNCTTTQGTKTASNGNQLATGQAGDIVTGITNAAMYVPAAVTTTFVGNEITITGSSSPHNNMQPYLTLNFCIAMQGVFPARP